jgi:sirohydrochlorin ferrochelatase
MLNGIRAGVFLLASALVAALLRLRARCAPKKPTHVVLVDNGSIRPASTLSLRRVACALEQKLALPCIPTSARYSDRIPADSLDGVRAETTEQALGRLVVSGVRCVVILPLFIGPAEVLTSVLPPVIARIQRSHPEFDVAVAAPLARVDAPSDDAVARMLAAHVVSAAAAQEAGAWLTEGFRVALCDHGSPSREVTAVRDLIARQLEILLLEQPGGRPRVAGPLSPPPRCLGVDACSMERRPGADFDFNEPTLARLLARPALEGQRVVVAMAFLSPGKHAEDGGDVATIVAEAQEAAVCGGRSPPLVVRTALLADSVDPLCDILARRFVEACGPSSS